MPAFKLPVPSTDAFDSHDELLRREEAGTRRRRLRRWLVVLCALVLIGGVIAGARPAVHLIKAWQARRLARQATTLTEAGKLDEASTKVQDALTIWRREPEAQRATALFLTRAGAYRPALGYWQELDKANLLTPADIRGFALVQLNLGDLDAAESLLGRVSPVGGTGTKEDWLLGIQVALQRGRVDKASTLATRLLQEPTASTRQRLQAANVLAVSPASDLARRTLAWQTLIELANDAGTPESLPALVMLAQARSGAAAGQLPANAPSLPELLARIEEHPRARAAQVLVALDLKMSQEPARRGEYLQAAIDRYGQSKDDADLSALAGWLYVKGEYDKVLAVLPPSRVATDRSLYLQSLDAMAALGKWADIRALIQSRRFPLDPMLAQMFLARCASQLGEPEVRDARWQAALEAAGKEPTKLITLGQYAAKNGSNNVAGTAFENAVRVAPDSHQAHEELVRFLGTAGDTNRLRAAATDFLTRWPQDAAARNEVAYLDALLNENVAAARAVARELVRAQPASLAFRTTLALCALRLHDGLGAVAVYELHESEKPVLQPRQVAIYAAALWEASFFQDAGRAIKGLPPDLLLPEERELIRPIKQNGVE